MEIKKIELRYFTGTGNSLKILETCRQAFEQYGFTVVLKPMTDGSPNSADCRYYGFCCPVYALGLPRVVRAYFTRLPKLPQPVPTLLLVTAGVPEEACWSLKHGREILDEKNFRVAYSDAVGMPSNWSPFMEPPRPEVAQRIIQKGEHQARATVEIFLKGVEYHRPFSLQKLGTVPSYLIYHGFRRTGLPTLWRHYKAHGNCTSCGLCARICPVKAITMKNGKPKWSSACEQCVRCFNACPGQAIEQLDIIGHGSRHRRYLAPGFKPDENG